MQSAGKLSRYLARELSLDDQKTEVLRYGAEIIFSTLLGVAAVVATAYFLGCLAETLAVLAAYAVIRTFAGGAHCSTPYRCAVTTVLIFPALGKAAAGLPAFLPGFEPYVLPALSICGLWLVVRLAPVDNPVNPIENPKRARVLKRNSIAAVVVITAVLLLLSHLFPVTAPPLVWGGAFGLAWAAAVLTRPVHRLMALADVLLGGAFGRGR